MRQIKVGLLLFLLWISGAIAGTIGSLKTDIASQDVQIFTAENDNGEITPKTIEMAFEKEGFFISEHRDMNLAFMKQFKKSTFDTYHLLTLYKQDIVRKLATHYPDIGLFTPMSISIYTKKGDKSISVGFLSASASARMMGIPETHKEVVKLGESIIRTLHKAMPKGKLEEAKHSMKASSGNFVARASLLLSSKADWEKSKEEFQTAFEDTLTPHGFRLSGFTDLGYDFEAYEIDTYHYYDVYSICRLEVIYRVAQNHPEAGAFAPCSFYMYQKADENRIYMAFPTIHKWISALGIEDKASIDVLMDAQKDFEAIIENLTESRQGSKW